jgi:phosphate transport system substrate-binding protein
MKKERVNLIKAPWKKGLIVLSSIALAFSLTACGGGNASENGANPDGTALSGKIKIDGSSTVFPITEAVAEEFQIANPDTLVTVGVSGTGGGFEKFGRGETDISNASRPIKDKELAAAKEKGIDPIEIPVAFDGLTVVVNSANDFVDHLTVEELNKIWAPDSTVKKWSEVREGWPPEEIKLYGPGTDSGTFDYFTEVINGESGASRTDYNPNEDDNILVQGVAGDKYSLGYFGYAYYVENQNKLKAVPIDGGNGPVAPTDETINNGTYSPLSRPIFIYVSNKSLDRPEVKAFVEFYLTEGRELVSEVGYIQLPGNMYEEGLAKIQQ